MSYVFCLGACYACKQPMTFNPVLVPSVVVNGSREPLCRGCIEIANPIRKAKGLAAIEILPGAYEPTDERELSEW